MSVIIIISLFWRCCMSREVMADEANLVTSSPLACKFTPVPDTFKASIFMSHISAKRQDSSTLRWVPVTLHRTSPDYSCFFSEMKEKPHGKCVRSTEVFPCFFLSCKANARVKLAKMGHSPHSSTLVVICVVWFLFVLFYVSFVCKCVLPPGDNTIAVNKYINIYFQNTHILCNMGETEDSLFTKTLRQALGPTKPPT